MQSYGWFHPALHKVSSYDTAKAHGRWSNAKTARLYINQATSEVGLLSLPAWGKARMAKGVSSLEALIDSV